MAGRLKPIKVAVVGLGRAGWNIHVRRMRGHEEFQITAVADWDPERQQEAADEFGCLTFSDHRRLLREAEAEVVVVATYSNTHSRVAIDALKSGRHVIVEKPMATSVPAAVAMVRAARKARKKLFVHQNYRFTPEVRHLLDVIEDRTIGEVFEARIRILGFSRRNDWQTLQKYGGGVLNNTGPHFVDVALKILGSPVKTVFGDLKLISDVGDAEDHCKVILRGENGRVVDLEISTACAMPEPKWTLLGTQGTLVSDGKVSKIRCFDPRKLGPLHVIETPLPGRIYGNEDVIPWEEREVPSVGRSIGDFYDNVWAVLRERGKMVVTAQDGVDIIKAIQAAKRKSLFQA